MPVLGQMLFQSQRCDGGRLNFGLREMLSEFIKKSFQSQRCDGGRLNHLAFNDIQKQPFSTRFRGGRNPRRVNGLATGGTGDGEFRKPRAVGAFFAAGIRT